MEQIEETTKKLFSFELNVSLIDHIRQFEHKEHHFKPGFLEQIYAHLSFYKDTQEAESFNQYSTNQYGLTLQEIVLFVHFQFSAISNLQDFISLLQEDLKIRSLKISQINSTNILSIHTIEDMKSKINQEQVESILAQLKPVYAPKLKINILQDTEDLKRKAKSKYHVIREQAKEEEDEGQFSEDKLVKSEELLQEESPNEDTNSEQKSTTATNKEVLNTEKQVVTEKEVVVTEKEVVKPKETTSPLTKIEGEFELNITYDLLMVAIMSKGKLDLHSVSYLSDKINDKTDLSLHHACFDFLEKREQREEAISSYNANYSNQFKEICNQCIKLQLNKEIYQQYRKRLTTFRQGKHKSQQGYLQMKKEVEQMLHEIQTFVQNFIVSRNKIQQHYLEKLLIGMLGHTLRQVRDSAVVLLNVLYDGVDWQLNSASTVKVFNVHRKFVINYLVESQDDSDIYVQLKSNIFIPGCHQSISSIHKPSIKEFRVINNRRFVHVNLHLGRFTRCGFYDWRIVRLGENDISNVYKFTEINDIVSQEIKGRIIVHPRITRDLQIHEVFVDLQNGVQDERTGKLTKRGNFKTVTEALPEYKERGVNCLYLMGALERDNGHCITQENEQMIHKTARPNASPLAVTNRDYPNSMMGGKDGFRELTRKAEDLNLHIIVDSLTRVSSSRMHRKYRKYQLQSLDNQGKLVNVFGTDGRAMHFEDTSLLNYRKKKCWDLFLKEIMDFTKQYKIQGIHLDNGQSWPQILRLNEEEMYRYDVDGSEAYTIKEIFEGKIVVQGEEQSGYWGSNAKETMPNPFLIKLCRKLWETYPHYLIISECWGKMGGFEEAREFSVIQSGPIPRLFKFPQAICQFFGKSLRKDGSIHKLKEPKNVSYFKKWYENTIDSLPENANVIQSTTYHTFPYPALLYKRGTWAAVDLFFFLGDLPMTFIGEKEGKATKVKTTNFFETLTVEQEHIHIDSANEEEEDGDSMSESGRSENSMLSGSLILSQSEKLDRQKEVPAS